MHWEWVTGHTPMGWALAPSEDKVWRRMTKAILTKWKMIDLRIAGRNER